MVGDRRLSAWILILTVNSDGIVPFRARPVIARVRPGGAFRRVVLIGAWIAGPSHAAGVENKRAEIEVAVEGLVVAPFDGDENRLWVVPGAPQKPVFHTAKHSLERPRFLFRRASVGLIPYQIERARSGGFEQLLLLPSVHGIAEAACQPEHFRSRLGPLARVAVVEDS